MERQENSRKNSVNTQNVTSTEQPVVAATESNVASSNGVEKQGEKSAGKLDAIHKNQ